MVSEVSSEPFVGLMARSLNRQRTYLASGGTSISDSSPSNIWRIKNKGLFFQASSGSCPLPRPSHVRATSQRTSAYGH